VVKSDGNTHHRDTESTEDAQRFGSLTLLHTSTEIPLTKPTSENWERVNELFEAAIGHLPAERLAFVAEACGDDASLRQELESLLASYEEAPSFMEQPAVGLVAEAIVAERRGKLAKGQLVGNYRIVSELGAGGQGAVYRALDAKLGRTIALKLLPAELVPDETSRKRFQREAQLASALDHPNICTVHDLQEAGGHHFIVMQFVPGRNVRDLVNGSPLQLSSALKIAIQVCDALTAAHAQGIIHRDIKAHNIIVTDKGQAKILDFGLAKLTRDRADGREQTELTDLGSPYGTPSYAAPEQSRGDKVDHRADIFSTGVLLYEMLAGTWPFRGKTAIDVRHAVLHSTPVPVAERRGEETPARLQEILDRALAKEPRQRYQDISQMRDDLISVFRELPDNETSDPAGFLENFKSIAPRHIWTRNKPARLIATAALVLAIVVAGAFLYRANREVSLNPPPAKIRSIAVLPFQPLGAANGDEYLELGMADALISRLSTVQDLSVRPTSAVLKYTKSTDALAVGRELNVDAILDGRIQRDGDKLRVTVQLIRTGNGEIAWFGRFDEDFKGIFAVQDSISERLVGELAMQLTTEGRQLITRRYTENTVAYQHYLKGRYFWNKWNRANLSKAIENFELALKEDPSYAPAHAGLADSYELQGYLEIVPPKEAYPKAEIAVLKALELDDNLGEAHLVLAKIRLFYNWNLAAAKLETERALTLIPGSSDAHGFYGTYWVVIGELDKALAERKRAQDLDPITAFSTLGVAWAYEYRHEYDNAIAEARKALELEPNLVQALENLGNCYEHKGMNAEAVAAYLQGKSLVPVPPEKIQALRQAFETAGIKGYWQKELEFAKERMKEGAVSPHRMARIYTELGDKAEAIAWLEKAFAERNSLVIFLKTTPMFDPLRDDPRYVRLLERIGLTRATS
jgi:eukaryotic-like serine/threonine-protein kinase